MLGAWLAALSVVLLKELVTSSYSSLVAKSLIYSILSAVQHWFSEHQPDVVVLAAAKVGGINANKTYPAEFLTGEPQNSNECDRDCLEIWSAAAAISWQQLHLPKFAEQPIKEESLLTGPLESTNEWYSIAKISGIKLCEALRKQHGFDAISLMPTNLYGPGDNYHPENSHVLPALLRRFHEAKQNGDSVVICWGSGSPLREFLYVDDLGEACVFALQKWSVNSHDSPCDVFGQPLPFLNVGIGTDLTIRELAKQIAEVVGFEGRIDWDTSKPDGTPQKKLDVIRLQKMGWSASIPLEQGLQFAYQDFQQSLAGDYLRS